MPISTGFNHVATLTTDMNRTVRFCGELQQLGPTLSVFFRDPDGMELEVCCPAG
jgi:catechol 2,3-dioxygenase-like lactoylglutathione lyase family enzyme